MSDSVWPIIPFRPPQELFGATGDQQKLERADLVNNQIPHGSVTEIPVVMLVPVPLQPAQGGTSQPTAADLALMDFINGKKPPESIAGVG
jgi:hypothetical protein